MDTKPFLEQVDRELALANRSVAFWRDQIAQHPEEKAVRQLAGRSIEFTLATIEHLEQTKKALRNA